jgi:hypothetical protein
MGDCRISIQISRKCLDGKIEGKNNVDLQLMIVSKKLWSADSTVYELLESTSVIQLDSTSLTLLSLIRRGSVSVWDCTSYPPMNITELCNDDGLCRIKTLFSVGWFPSGSLQFLPSNAEPVFASPDLYDDVQYNINPLSKKIESAESIKSLNKVLLLHGEVASAAPSQVLQGVVDRFIGDEMDGNMNQLEVVRIRQENYQKRKEAEAIRNRKLDDRIRKLSNNGKNQPVSDQVRKLLIKSRATGRTSVRPEDRVYLHFIFWNDLDDIDTKNDESFRFFSIQDTVGHALDSLGDLPDSQRMEMLVKTTSTDMKSEYRQLPYALRLYDAIDQNFLSKEVNTVIIRCFDPNDKYTTPSVVSTNNGVLDPPAMGTSDLACKVPSTAVLNDLTEQEAFVTGTSYRLLIDALKSPLQASGRISIKTSSATKEKVRHMQIKSKAKGDAKRVKAVEQRYFLHCITVVEKLVGIESSGDASVEILEDAAIFVCRLDPLHRLLRERAPDQTTIKGDKLLTWEFLVVGLNDDDITLHCILTSDATKDEKELKMTWNDAEESGIVKCFDTVVLRYIVD